MKRIVSLFAVALMVLLIAIPAVFAADYTSANVVDMASLFTDEQGTALSTAASEIGAKYDCDIVFVTTPDLMGYSTKQELADDFYDYNGYKPDGVLVLLTLLDENGKRGIYTSTTGKCIDKFSVLEQDEVFDDIYDDLVAGNYYEAMLAYANGIDYYLPPRVPFTHLLIALGIGFVAALLIMLGFKLQLKSVAMQHGAQNYVRNGSMKVNVSRDTFLYSTVTRTAKPKDNSNNTHTGSSGTSHGGSGHSF